MIDNFIDIAIGFALGAFLMFVCGFIGAWWRNK